MLLMNSDASYEERRSSKWRLLGHSQAEHLLIRTPSEMSRSETFTDVPECYGAAFALHQSGYLRHPEIFPPLQMNASTVPSVLSPKVNKNRF
jgi:hypothetical protein